MNFAPLIGLAERLPLPDALTRRGIAMLVGRTDRRRAGAALNAEARFAETMTGLPIAEHTEAANQQHYEVPAAFFAEVLGPRRKYSCCLYAETETTLAEAEEAALVESCRHADLRDGQTILELGCGWGSLSIWMAETYPASRITAVSNSSSQRAFIERRVREKGLTNLRVVTADMNVFSPSGRFDRIVSIEMFEHMANWGMLLERARGWLRPDGRLFVHVFAHRTSPYRFDRRDEADWIAQHFFTGGIMPSHGLVRQFGHLFAIEAEWRWDGRHYARTARDWLARFDAHLPAIRPLLAGVYGAEARLWERRWRLFLLATEGLFGHADGESWGVSHYLLRPAG